jgi:hypothetical protein
LRCCIENDFRSIWSGLRINQLNEVDPKLSRDWIRVE